MFNASTICKNAIDSWLALLATTAATEWNKRKTIVGCSSFLPTVGEAQVRTAWLVIIIKYRHGYTFQLPLLGMCFMSSLLTSKRNGFENILILFFYRFLLLFFYDDCFFDLISICCWAHVSKLILKASWVFLFWRNSVFLISG